MRQEDIILCRGLSKSYEGEIALDMVNLDIPKGSIFGLIGPDGAGKTTLFRIIATLLKPDSGTVSVMGMDVLRDYREIRRNLGYMPGRFSLYPDLTVKENLEFYASVYNSSVSDNYHLIEDIYDQIKEFSKRRASKLSGGMKQKLALCCALIHSPAVLILDEPTTGVDAVSRREFWDTLKKLKNHGISILVSTPYMDEARRCDKIALIQKGRILGVDSPESLIDSLDVNVFAIKGGDRHLLVKELKKIKGPGLVKNVYLAGQEVHFTSDQQDNAGFYECLVGVETSGISIELIRPDIEDCFIHLMTD